MYNSTIRSKYKIKEFVILIEVLYLNGDVKTGINVGEGDVG
jgi:hypothetical protein